MKLPLHSLDKLWLMNHSSKIHRMFVNQSLGLMQVSSTSFQCVKICQQDCTRDWSLTLICRNSRLDIKELETLRIWSYLINRKQDQNVKLRVFLHLENRKTSTVLMRTVIVITVRQCSKQRNVTNISVLVKKLMPP